MQPLYDPDLDAAQREVVRASQVIHHVAAESVRAILDRAIVHIRKADAKFAEGRSE